MKTRSSANQKIDVISIAKKCADMAGIKLPRNVTFLVDLARIESNFNTLAKNGSHFGLFQFNIKRAQDVAKGAYSVRGGFCDRLGIKNKRLNRRRLMNPYYSVPLALDSIIWSNVETFSEFYCLHVLPGAVALIESGNVNKGVSLFRLYGFRGQSREAVGVLKEGVRTLIKKRGL